MDLTTLLLAALGAGVVYLIYLSIKYKGRAAFTYEMKGVPQLENSLPLIGHLVYFGQFGPYIHDKFTEWEKKYDVARLNFWVPGVAKLDSLVTFNVKDIETILRDPYTFTKGSGNREIFGPFFGQGIFSADSDLWKVQRKVASNIFNIRSFRDFYTPVFAEDATTLRNHLGAVVEKSKTDPRVFVDIQDMLLRSTMESFVRLSTGVHLGNMAGTGTFDAEGKFTLHPVPFAIAFDLFNVICTKRASNPLWKITEHFDGSRKKLAWCRKTIDEFSNKVINDKRAKLEKAGGSKPDGQRNDLLDFFMEVTHDDGTPMSQSELGDMIVNMTLAGRDTTAQTMSWVVYRMDKHPEVADKMREEMDAVLGKENKDAIPDYEQILKLKYCLAVFHETLRLHSNVPLNFKQNDSDGPVVLAGSGTTVYPSQRIFFHTWAMGYSEKIWGPQAGEFMPERWLDEKGSVRKEDTYKYPAFNAGPRICLGMDMAKQEAMVLTTALFRRYRYKVIREDDPEKWGDFAGRRGRYDLGATLGVRKALDVQVIPI